MPRLRFLITFSMEGRAMSTITRRSGNARAADSYLGLIQEQPLRAIRTRTDYRAASNMIDRLAERDDLDKGERSKSSSKHTRTT
jgi:hypothetical protein